MFVVKNLQYWQIWRHTWDSTQERNTLVVMFVVEDLQYTGSSRNISECTQETNHFALMSVGKFQLANTSEDTQENPHRWKAIWLLCLWRKIHTKVKSEGTWKPTQDRNYTVNVSVCYTFLECFLFVIDTKIWIMVISHPSVMFIIVRGRYRRSFCFLSVSWIHLYLCECASEWH